MKCPWGEKRNIPKGCRRCVHHDKRKGCLKTYYRQSSLAINATLIRSLAAAGPQKGIVVESIIKQAKGKHAEKALNCNVEGWRFMGAWKN